MKTSFLPRLAFLLCLAILLGALPVGCTTPEPEPEPVPTITLIGEGAPGYTIIRRELDPTRVMIDLAVHFSNALKEATGTKLPLSTDYVNRNETPPTDTLEILIGETNRQESIDALAALGENEYVIKFVNNRLVLIGQNDDASVAAVNAFLTQVLGYDAATGLYAVTELVLPIDLCITGTYVPTTIVPGEEDEPTDQPRKETTEPLLRQEGSVYSYSDAKYACTDAGEDEAFLHENRGHQLSYCRFADGGAHITYVFDIHDKYEPLITYTIGNDYKIEISPDNETWALVYDWTEENESCHDRSNQGAFAIAPYDFEIYDTCYIKFTDATPTDGWGACFVDFSFAYYMELDLESLNIFNLEDDMYDILSDLDYTTEDPSSVSAYKIDTDGGLIYNPISREKADQLSKYDAAATNTGTIKTTVSGVEYTLTYRVPKNVTAYDAVPIWYEVTTNKSNAKPVYIEATAFEDPSRVDSEDYYALTLPDKVDVTWEYLGFVGGDDQTSNRPKNTATAETSKTGKQYPQYNATDLLYTGDCKQSSIMWWKFRYTNTGNTILDGDGNGTFCVEAVLYRKNASGGWDKVAGMENIYNRIIDTLYPGESGEMYFIFDNCYNLATGDYKIIISSLVRNETSNPENYGRTIWGGEVYSQSEFTFKISAKGSDTEPDEVKKTSLRETPARNVWLHRYEEFMTSYDSLLRGVKNNAYSDVMYLQCAPWTEQITLRLIIGNDDTKAAVAIPLDVETDSLKINFNPDNNNYVVLEDGTRFPVITAQSMADMRGNVQLGPDAAYNVIDNLMDMKDIGINTINTTAAFEFDGSFGTNRANNIDACWFSLDVARVLGMKTEGWICYPYENSGSMNQANQLFGTAFKQTGFGSADLALANALNTIWQYLRWGDNYWVGGDDVIVLDVEDTRGWMRVDFNARFKMTESSKNNFRLFLMDKYGDIDSLNSDWGSEFASFDEIDPEAQTTDDHGWRSYKNKNAVFGEWGRAIEVLDMFRTLERVYDYQMLLEEVHKTMPTALISVRTEGANWIAPVDPTTDNSHLRHVYYSQRRCAIIPEIISEAGVLYASSDYTTLPYTPSEVAELTAASVENGIVPMLLPQFNRMRDIAINEKYGTDFTYEYNLKGKDTKGAYINTVCSVYEWFVATYENGGVPGILWQDYLCDGYATETQRREIAFFTEKLTEALNTPEGKAWAKQSGYDASVLDGSAGLWSYDRAMVEDLIDRVAGER